MKFEAFDFPARRSCVIARQGIVATSQPLAAQAGLDVLKMGGNAVDAAVAAVATLCVVEPTSTGIGGDAFALIWIEDERKLYGINASGPAPASLSADLVRSHGHVSMPELGALTVTVPGSVRGWQLALERFGSLGLDSLLSRPISYAREGFPVSQRIGMSWHHSSEKMSAHPDSRRVWLPGGKTPRPGEIFKNEEVASSLSALAEDGYDAFYHGDIARQITACVQEAGGVLTLDDLANYEAEWVSPISLPYGEYVFHEIPPNGQGLTALIALSIARHFDLPSLSYGSADYYHALIEAMKLAFIDAHAYIGDPRFADVPVTELLSESYGRERHALISNDQALFPTPGEPNLHGDTVYLTVADGDGNMVSWIQSLYLGFGSGLTAGTTGIQLQNRGANFTLVPGHPNEVAPGKRPFHTIIPGFITKDGHAWSSFGVMGAFMQPQGHLQVGVNMIDFEMDPQTALEAPRFMWMREREVGLEPAISVATRDDLARRGHQLVDPVPRFGFGGGQIIVRDQETGVLIGGSEPRKDGAAVGW